jgi:ATP-dependent exoDNAse (exonuclease V) beta subunit
MADRPAPTELQQAAIDDRERDLFLVAGAGTGKTTVLVDRYCEAVTATDGPDAETGIDNVLAFTFTERAAGQLKRRIRAELLRRAEEDATRRAWLRALARDSEAAWITTIHGFCQRLLASHSLAAGLDPRYTVLDEGEAARLSQQAFDRAFDEFAAAGGDDDRFEMAAAFGVEPLREMVAAAHDELRSQGQDRPELPEVEPVDPAAAVAALRAAAELALEATADQSGKWADEYRGRMAAALAGTNERVPEEGEADGWGVKSSAAGFAIDAVAEYTAACKALDRVLAEAGFAHYYGYVRELLTLYGSRYEHLKLERSALDFEDLQLRARALLRDNPAIRRRYQARFRHVMVDEFQDTNRLQASLIELLHLEDGVPQGILFTVGDELQAIYGFRHADVDVFRAERRRAARIQAEAEAAGVAAPAGVRLLTGNFRSDPQVLALVNRIGKHFFGKGYTALDPALEAQAGGPRTELLVTEIKGWPDDYEFQGLSADEQAQPWRLAEAEELAGRLSDLVESHEVRRGEIVVLLRSYTHVQAYERALAQRGLRPYVVGGRGYWSRQQVTDTLALLALIANPLDDRAVMDVLAGPACGVSPDALWLLRQGAGRAPVWWAIRRLFAAAEEGETGEDQAAPLPDPDPEAEPPDDDDPVPPPAEGPSWSERVDAEGAHIPDDDAARIRRLVQQLETLRETAPSLALDALVDRAVTETGYDLSLLMRDGGRRRMANVRKLMRLARDYEAAEGRDLRGFLDWARSEGELSRREAEATIQAEDHDGVRIMTIHGAKGLEFPVVAVADLGRSMASAGPGSALRLAPAPEGEDEPMRVGLRLARLGRGRRSIFEWQELSDAAAEREREEERRLLHVAMTRAERRLLLSGAVKAAGLEKDPTKGEPLMGGVLRALGWSPGMDKVKPWRTGPSAAVRFRTPPGQDGAAAEQMPLLHKIDVDAATDAGPVPLPDPDMSPPAPPGATPPVTHLSYSALSLYQRCGYRFYVERVLGVGRSPADGRGAAVDVDGETEAAEPDPLAPEDTEALEHRYARGIVVHELLEAGARAGWDPPSDDLAAALLTREGVPAPAGLGRVQGLVRGFLDSPLRAELSEAAALHPELPFAFKLGELIVRGEIDLLAELGDEVVVVDYKSDALGDDEPASHMSRYEVQRKIYALAALRRYGLPVRVVYSFLDRPLDPVEQRFEPADIERLTADLEGAASGIHAGRFEVTQEPNLALCFDCPARKRLCSWDESRTLAS